jgi:uncharacterized protein (DUF302 family)
VADWIDTQITSKISPLSVADTVLKLTGILEAKKVRVFAVIDQSAAAREVGQELRDTTLVIFGNPAAGTPVMAAVPLAALDLPLKVLIWADGDQTKVTYVSPAALVERYNLDEKLAAGLASIDPLTDALVAG